VEQRLPVVEWLSLEQRLPLNNGYLWSNGYLWDNAVDSGDGLAGASASSFNLMPD
jgi:hypothetical protein